MNAEYFPEILRYIVSKSKRYEPNYSDQLQGWMRDKVSRWLWDICEESNYKIETFQLSILIFSNFITTSETTRNTLQLVGIVSLFLAIKYHEKTTLSIAQVSNYCSNRYSLSNIQITELYILQKLEWRLDIPTASEISKDLLLATGISYDLSRIFERIDAFSVICYLDFKLSRYSQLEIAITSAVCALEQFNQLAFRNQWINLLNSKISIDLVSIDLCKQGLVENLLLTTPAIDRYKIECLTRETVSSLIINKNN